MSEDTSSAALRAAVYLRVSTEEQASEGHSLDAQRDSTVALVAQRGWLLTGEYVDAGHSAKRDAHRPAFERLLADAHAGRFDVVVVDKVDRFYRYLKGLLIALDSLNNAGVSFVSVRENIDLSTPWGKITLTVLGMLAEIYIDNLREETRKGRVQRARKGLYNGSIPFGYCRGNCSACTDPNGVDYCPAYGGADRAEQVVPIPHPVESAAVQMAFRWYLTGRYADGDIAERLNREGYVLPDGASVHFRTKGILGRFAPGRFGKDSIRHLLQNPFYAGLVAYYGRDERDRRRKRRHVSELFPGQHQALIAVDEFERAQELRQRLTHCTRNAETNQPHIYPLSGLLVCDHCGQRMRGVGTTKGRRYYRDATRIERREACEQPNLRADEIEERVVEWLRALIARLPADWRERVTDALIPAERQASLAEQEEEIQARVERATRLYLEGHIAHEQFLEEKHRAQIALANLCPAEMGAIIALGELLENFDSHWAKARTPLEKNGLLREALARVRVQGYTLTAVQPSLAFYPLVEVCRSGADGRHSR